ncbi:MAG: 16S rRNA (guanine(527)-N(7))-methyltransferase RsmG [Bacilli bacterium]|nr:16S rRNA (guanine(527)-N(7))-methyltransferase RsmG [Bacilli bacterium]
MTDKILIEELKKIGILLTKEQLDKLNKFYDLLIDWNKKINLTRITEKNEVNLKHFYDSLTLIKTIDLEKISTMCDLGSGAGFPGIVIKICFPNINITLIDSLNKRVTYLNEIIKELDLEGIIAIHERAEEYSKENIEKYDLVTARAVSDLRIISEMAMPMVKINGNFVAMKANADEEIEKSKNLIGKLDSIIEEIVIFELPVENSKRTLIKLKKLAKTNGKFPRSMDKIKKELKNNYE